MADTVYGIDLGTTFCACASVEVGGADPRVVRLEDKYHSLASVVLVKSAGQSLKAHVGRDAYHKFSAEDCLVEYAKRHIGRQHEESMTWFLGRHEFDPIDISALILKKIGQGIHLDRNDDRAPIRAVVTHPRDFHQMQKQATADAAVAAGVDLIETLNEPEAASYMYFEPGADRTPGKYLVFDLGGGTLDIAILDVPAKGRPQIIGGHGMSQLGGKDWDDKLLESLVKAVEHHHHGRIDVRAAISPHSHLAWRQKAREWKEKRGRRQAWTEEIRWQTRDGEEVVTPVELSCSQWDHDCEALVGHCEATIDQALQDAGVRSEQIVRVLPVGGSMRLRMVQEMLSRRFGNRVDRIDTPGAPDLDTVVAEGAARFAGFHAASSRKSTLTPAGRARLAEIEDVIPVSTLAHGINVLTLGPQGNDILSAVIPHNTPLPCRRERQYKIIDDQALVIEIYEGPAGPKPPGVEPSAVLAFPSHLRPQPGENVHVEVDVSHSGRIKVRAKDPDNNVVEGELHAAGTQGARPESASHQRRVRLASIAVI